MSENDPSTQPVPPKPGEAAKVQPKKETVRIALPPKPTAAPTVRLPAPAPAAAAPSAAAPVAAGAPKPAPAAPTAAAPKAPSAGSAASAPAPMSRPALAPSSYGGGISGLDKGLAIAAAVVGLAFLLHVVLIALGIQVE
jgi:hypothetical protein